jgi:hypothetical protein
MSRHVPERRNPGQDGGDLVLDLRDHEICWVLPPGSALTGTLDIPGGALVQGTFVGRLRCARGSLVVAADGEFTGEADADRIYVDGTIRSIRKGEPSVLRGQQLVAISEHARGQAELISRAFAIHTRSFAARITTVREA